MHGGGAGGAGVLDTRRRLEAEQVGGLQHQPGREVLRREAAVEVAEHDLVDVLRPDLGMGERLGGDAHDQALDGLRDSQRPRPDLILLDVVMDGIDGYGVLDALRRSVLR